MKRKLTLTMILSLITAAPQLMAMKYSSADLFDTIDKDNIELVKKNYRRR